MQLPDHPPGQHKNLGYAFIKTGYDDVRDELVDDFADNGLEVIHERVIILPPRVVDYIYRESMTEHFYPEMRRHLICNPVRSMAIYREGGDAQQILLDLKHGSNARENLRKKYTHHQELLSEDELHAWSAGTHPHQHSATIHLTQNNVFHTADTASEALHTLFLLGREYEGYYDLDDSRSINVGKRGLLLAQLSAGATIRSSYDEI